MLNYRSHIIGVLVVSLLIFTGCIESKYGFDAKRDSWQSLFKTLPGINGNSYNGSPVTKNAVTAEVYLAAFNESVIEKDNLLEITQLNRNSHHPRVDYWHVEGFSQDMYLVKYDFTYKEGAEEYPVTGIVFFSLRYRPQKESPYIYCTGPGPAYWGSINMNYISFDSVLLLKKVDADYSLRVQKPNRKDPFNLLFLPAAFPETPEKEAPLNITKIVRASHNKVGGDKPLVFDIPVIFRDSAALQFNYKSTINLK